MPALILLALKRLGGAVWGWLSSLTLWQLASLGLAIILIIQHFQLLDARHDRDAWRKQYNAEHAKLQAISSKRNEQKAETKERIKVVTRTIRDADGKAKAVEQAPLPGQCRTPSEIMRADI